MAIRCQPLLINIKWSASHECVSNAYHRQKISTVVQVSKYCIPDFRKKALKIIVINLSVKVNIL